MSPPSKSHGKKKSFPYILFPVTLFCVWFVWTSTHPELPEFGKPPKLYSNQAGVNLSLSLIQSIEKAKKSIFMVMFGLSDSSILNILSKKIQKKVPTTIFYDPIGSPDIRKFLHSEEIHPVKNRGLMHQKLLVLDDEVVFIGSANFTEASLKMHDNLVVGLSSRKIAKFIQTRAPDSFGNIKAMVGGQNTELWLLPDPKGQALSEVRKKIRLATRSVRLALFTFTHPLLCDELIRAHRRGVEVILIIDLYSALGASAKAVDQLSSAGIPVFTSRGNKLLHHKFSLIDDTTLIMGSANWTKSAFTKNNDCLFFLYNLNQEQKKVMERLWNQLKNEGKEKS